MKVEIELPEIPGYEYTGEFRTPRECEVVLAPHSACVMAAGRDWVERRIILRPLPPPW
jgi:hypothetical protein